MTPIALRVSAAGVFGLLSLMAPGCMKSDAPVYSHFEELGADGWRPADMLLFEPVPVDSDFVGAPRCDMHLVIRRSARAERHDIPLAIAIEDESGFTLTDTIIVNAEGMGPDKWRTDYGVQQTDRVIARGVRPAPGLSVTVSPLAPKHTTRGLLNVGLVLTPSK